MSQWDFYIEGQFLKVEFIGCLQIFTGAVVAVWTSAQHMMLVHYYLPRAVKILVFSFKIYFMFMRVSPVCVYV